MSYDLMVIDKRKRFSNKKEFLEWYNAVIEWDEDVDYDDYRRTTPSLQKWFLEIKNIIPPLNGEFAPSVEELGNGEFQEGDYAIAKEAIYVAFAWSDAERIHPLVANLANKCDVALFDISNDKVLYPDGYILDLSNGSEATSNSFLKKLRNFFHI